MTSCGINTMMSLGTSSSVVLDASHGIHTVTSFGSNIPTVNESPFPHTRFMRSAHSSCVAGVSTIQILHDVVHHLFGYSKQKISSRSRK